MIGYLFFLCGTIAFLSSCHDGRQAFIIDPPTEALQTALNRAESNPLFEPADNIPEEWWTLFNDVQLSDFIDLALEKNPSLQAARASVIRSHLAANRVKSALYPTLALGGDVSRQKLSETALIPFASQNSPGATPGGSGLPLPAGQALIPVYFTQYETEFALTYDFDLWGKNKNSLRAALSQVQAQVADEAFKRLQLSVAVASVYYELQTAYERREIAKQLAQNKKQTLELIKNRVHANLNDLQTKTTAQTNASNATKQLLQVESDVIVSEYKLKSLLAGQFDEEIMNVNLSEMPLPKVPLPVDLPLHLISRRPDITAQLWQIESAGKEIEVAKASFYPDFNLMAFFGFQTIHLHDLFVPKSKFFNVDPAFTLPIFEGGRLQANLSGSEIDYDLAIFQYNELVLNAAKEVLEAIALLQNRKLQLEEARQSLEDQNKLLHLSELRVQHNLSSTIDFLVVQEGELKAKDAEALARGALIQTILSLIKALGGGFDVCNDFNS